jgi:hypothetical protein
MNSEDIVIVLGLTAFIILTFFSFKMGYEGLFKNYRKEIKQYFEQKGLNVLIVRKASRQERKNAFFKGEGLKITGYFNGPRTMYKKRIIETKDRSGKKEEHLLLITIRYFRKPKLEFNR